MAFLSLKYLIICICSFHLKYVYTYCSRIHENPSGTKTITSPNYPNKYPRSTYCTYKISVPSGYRIRLKIDNFNVPGKMPSCTNGYVRITRCSPSRKYLIKYCGRDFKPHDIYSSDNCIRVDFSGASRPRTGYGFKLSYRKFPANSVSVIKPASCSRVYVRENAAIVQSPNYPKSYSYSDRCTWKFNLSRRQRVKFLFMDVDLYKPQIYCGSSSNDVVILKGFKNGRSFIIKKVCGKPLLPFAWYSNREMDYFQIEFNPHRVDHKHKGFLLGFVIFNRNDGVIVRSNVSFSFPIPGIVAIIAFTVLFIVCFIFFKKRVARRNNNQMQAALNNTNDNFNVNTPVNAPRNNFITSPKGYSAVPVPPGNLPPSYQECLRTDQPYPPYGAPGTQPYPYAEPMPAVGGQPYPYGGPMPPADVQPYPYGAPMPPADVQPYPYGTPMPPADVQPYPYGAPMPPATSAYPPPPATSAYPAPPATSPYPPPPATSPYPPPPAYNSPAFQTTAPSVPPVHFS